MANLEEIRKGIIEKIRSIQNKEVLLALDEIISHDSGRLEESFLTEEQKLMLQMSEEDLVNGRTTPHEEVLNRVSTWLKEKNKKSS